METTPEQQPNTETKAETPERSRAWRIVAIVLTLHAALLGSVVLIQGCSKSDSPMMSEDKSSSNSADPKMVKEEQLGEPKLAINLPSSEALTPDEHLANADTSQITPSIQTPSITTENSATTSESTSGMKEVPVAKVDTLKIDSASKEVAPKASTSSAKTSVTPKAPESVSYSVKKGDTLSKIAKKYTVSVTDLASANKITTQTSLKIGQKLSIPSVKKTEVAKVVKEPTPASKVSGSTMSTTDQVTHIVKAHETPSSIAKQYGVSVAALMQANSISDPKKIRINQKLLIPATKMASEPAAAPKMQEPQPEASASLQRDIPLGYVQESSGT